MKNYLVHPKITQNSSLRTAELIVCWEVGICLVLMPVHEVHVLLRVDTLQAEGDK